ncbi:hypothetical protein [Cerasicoccus arenae]|uniref:SGNH/GDSL hydrolase family protein n=1 Tax=Cerasicoccus arenae TaxID=424488 RepID=A0A8J3DCC4_9BACT|nr:hypothetical protein [Cerasicoccus arenae]MBK1858452.1 hypothetical protein [Cerasicoccus arenae]GHC02652.1 hypothetical protein GCM10007047_19070 [Cerasicoccus arenae]
MKKKIHIIPSIIRHFAILIAILTATSSLNAKEIKALFVGNSYCDYNALNKQVEAMFEAAGEDALFKRETQGGFSWKKHWDGGQAERRIEKEADWNYVVLQNHSRSSLDSRAEFDDYGQRLIDLVKKTGAEPVLYMTWARQHLPQDQAIITEAYSSLGKRNNIKVAPVGLAFESWIEQHPDIPLHIHDRSHPTSEGSYLAACVIYATLTGKSPVGMPNIIEGRNWVTKGDHLTFFSPSLAQQLQETAWATVQAYNAEEYASDTPLTKQQATPATAATAAPTTIQSTPSNIRVNFGGSAEPGWNKVSGGKMATPIRLVDASGQPTSSSLMVIDDFESYENPNVVNAPLTGIATAFEGAKSASLFINREKGNPTAAVQLKLDTDKTYQFNIWASRAASGKRWGRYTVTGAMTETKFLAAGGNHGNTGNTSEVLIFANVRPNAEGIATLELSFPQEADPEFNVGEYAYLTGLIVSEQP